MTECKVIGTGKSERGLAYYRWAMVPGKAWKINDVAREHGLVTITEDMARRAEDQSILRFINGKTVVVFTVDNEEYAQVAALGGYDVGKKHQAAPSRAQAAVPAAPPVGGRGQAARAAGRAAAGDRAGRGRARGGAAAAALPSDPTHGRAGGVGAGPGGVRPAASGQGGGVLERKEDQRVEAPRRKARYEPL